MIVANKVCFWCNTSKISKDAFEKAVKAIQKQVREQVTLFWNANEYVGLQSEFCTAYKQSEIPQNSWLVVIQDAIKYPVYGYHYLTEIDTSYAKKGTPYAVVKWAENWTLILSHETVEMLINPFLNASALTEVEGKKIRVAVEPSDPAQFDENGYYLDGVLVSDFITPAYYNVIHVAGTRYSWTGKITKPLELLENGYFSFEYIDRLGTWFQMWKVKGKTFIKQLGANENNLIIIVLVLILLLYWTVKKN